nr:hypothetical protein [Nitrospinaceae bacterium]
PVPLSWQELSEWADALDEKIPEGQRVKPGALRRFCNKEESARQGFRRRLTETPGVVATSEEVLGTSLRVLEWKTDHKPSEKLLAAIDKVRKTWETPNGDIITEAVDMWRHMRELALGFWYRWNPPAPRDWLEARRAWKSHVREVLRHNRRRLDTELQVWNECERSESPPRVWTDWKEIRDEFRPNTVAEWIDDHAIRNCLRWLVHNDGICWVEHRAFGEQLAQVARVPYFGAGDDRILDTEETAIVASIRAHSQGKNLERWSRNLVPCPMTSGKEWEQLLGRTHRPGQEADEVICEVGLDWPELAASFEQARADALYIEDTIGQRQKLNYADLVITDTKEPRSGSGFSHSAREGGKEG